MSKAQNQQVREAAAREWQSSQALKAEFSSLEAYQAYRVAIQSGRARIAPSTLLHLQKQDAPAMHANRLTTNRTADVGAVEAAMREFQSKHQSYHRRELVAFVAGRTGLSVHEASEAIADTSTTRNPVA